VDLGVLFQGLLRLEKSDLNNNSNHLRSMIGGVGDRDWEQGRRNRRRRRKRERLSRLIRRVYDIVLFWNG
jgi:hypothetical protein